MEELLAKLAVHDHSDIFTILRFIIVHLAKNRIGFALLIGTIGLLIAWLYTTNTNQEARPASESYTHTQFSDTSLSLLYQSFVDKWRSVYPIPTTRCISLLIEHLNAKLNKYESSYNVQLDSINLEGKCFRKKQEALVNTFDSGRFSTDECFIFPVVELQGNLSKVSATSQSSFKFTFENLQVQEAALDEVSLTFPTKPSFHTARSNLDDLDNAVVVNILLNCLNSCSINLDTQQLDELSTQPVQPPQPLQMIAPAVEELKNEPIVSPVCHDLPEVHGSVIASEPKAAIVLPYNTKIKDEINNVPPRLPSGLPRSASDYGNKGTFPGNPEQNTPAGLDPAASDFPANVINPEKGSEDATLTPQPMASAAAPPVVPAPSPAGPPAMPPQKSRRNVDVDLSPLQERMTYNLAAKKLLVRIVRAEFVPIKSTSSAYCVVELHEPYQRHTTHVIPYSEELLWDQHLLFTLNSNSKRANIELFELSKRKSRAEVLLPSLMALFALQENGDKGELFQRLPLIPVEPGSHSSSAYSSIQQLAGSSNITPGIGQLGPTGGMLLSTGATVAGLGDIQLDTGLPAILAEFNFMERVMEESRRSVVTLPHKQLSKTSANVSAIQSTSLASFPSGSASVTMARRMPNSETMPTDSPLSMTNLTNNGRSPDATQSDVNLPGNGANLTHSQSLDVVHETAKQVNQQAKLETSVNEAAAKAAAAKYRGNASYMPRTMHRRANTTKQTSSGVRPDCRGSPDPTRKPGLARRTTMAADISLESRLCKSSGEGQSPHLSGSGSSSAGNVGLSLACSVEELEPSIGLGQSGETSRKTSSAVGAPSVDKKRMGIEEEVQMMESSVQKSRSLRRPSSEKKSRTHSISESNVLEDQRRLSMFMRRLKGQKSTKAPVEECGGEQNLGGLALLGPSSQLASMAAGISKWSDDTQSVDMADTVAQVQSTILHGATGIKDSPSSPSSRSPSCSLSSNSKPTQLDDALPPPPPTLMPQIINSGQPAYFATPLSTALADQPGFFPRSSSRRSVALSPNSRLLKLFKTRKKRYRSLGAEKLLYLDNVENLDFDAISTEGYMRIVQDN